MFIMYLLLTQRGQHSYIRSGLTKVSFARHLRISGQRSFAHLSQQGLTTSRSETSLMSFCDLCLSVVTYFLRIWYSSKYRNSRQFLLRRGNKGDYWGTINIKHKEDKEAFQRRLHCQQQHLLLTI